jgi:Flp pilus assembly protein TadB
MARGRGQGPQRPIKGFRPGKEPPELRKRRAQEQFGELSGAQRQLVEVFANRTPDESRALIRRWTVGLLAAALVFLVAAAALFLWSTVAGAVVGVLAVILLVLWWRVRSQRDALETMADTVSGPGRGRRKRRK